jgi:hypothetical protein
VQAKKSHWEEFRFWTTWATHCVAKLWAYSACQAAEENDQ